MLDRVSDLLNSFRAGEPLERARTIPNTWYTSDAIAALERDRVFGASWLVAGRTDQVARPGQFFTAELAGQPILAVRGEDGVLRAFRNVCRHRAARVACDEQGQATKLRCRYHGWTYDLAGQLRGVPEFEGVADFRREDNGLQPLHVDTWGPLVFIHLGDNPAPLPPFLAPMPDRLAKACISAVRFAERRTYELGCNWKVFVDNYLDGGYHVNTIHESLAGVLDYKNYRTDVFEWCSVQSSPMRKPDEGREDASAAVVRTGTEAAYWWLYPNFMLNAYGGVMDTNLVLPLGPDRCRVIFDFYFDPQHEGHVFQAQSISVADRIQAEDVGICEDVQRGLKSGAFIAGRYSVRREVGVYHFHQLLAKALQP